MDRFLVDFLIGLSYIESERHRSWNRKTVSQDSFLGAGVGARARVFEQLFSKHRCISTSVVGRNSLAPSYVCRIWTFRRSTTRSKNNLASQQRRGGRFWVCGGAVSMMIQATSEATHMLRCADKTGNVSNAAPATSIQTILPASCRKQFQFTSSCLLK